MKTIAVLTIKGVGKMTPEERKDIANWLSKQAEDLFKKGDQYGKKVIARFMR